MAFVPQIELTRGGENEFANVDNYPEATGTMTFTRMQPVKLTTLGTLEDAQDSEMHFGLALTAAAGTDDTSIPVLRLNRDQEFAVSLSNAGTALATAQTHVGLVCSWIKSTETGHAAKITADTNNVTDDVFEIIKLDTRDAVGTVGGRVIVRFMRAKIQARQTA